MSTDAPANPFAKSVVLDIPGMHTLALDREVPWGTGEDRVFDLYRPEPEGTTGPPPAVVLVTGHRR